MSQGNIDHDVFLSYNNRDHVAVEAVARQLTEQDLRVFLDRWYLVAGTPWPEHLESVLSGCRAAAVFIGPHGMGRWQQREQYLALDRQARDASFPVIPVLLPGADPALGFLLLNTWVDLRRGTEDAASLRILSEAIQGRAPGPDAQRRTATARFSICPYRGLRFFREEDAAFFFGRNAFIARLATYVEQHPLVAVVGASGSGKSSVVRAGLVPRLRQTNGSLVWDIVTMVPGDRPLHSLSAVMVRLLEPQMTEVERLNEVGKLAESLGAGRVALRDVVSAALRKQNGTDRLMLIVDQWEELHTLTRDAVLRQRFLDEILAATAAGQLSVVLTMRGDFFGEALAYRPFSDALQDAVVNISRLDDYVSSLVQCVLMAAPEARFVFIPMRSGANHSSYLGKAIDRLPAVKPAVLLFTYSHSDREAERRTFERVTALGILVVLAARNPSEPESQMPLGNPFMTVGATNLTGTRSSFSAPDPELYWSPGEDLPLTSRGKPLSYSGTGPAAAIAAGVAIRVLDRHPELSPAQLLDVLRTTSKAHVPNGPSIVNLDAALARLR